MSSVPYDVDLQFANEPNGPVATDMELAEIRLDDALRHIKKIDGEIKRMHAERETRMKQLAGALTEIQKKCEAANHVLGGQAPPRPDLFA